MQFAPMPFDAYGMGSMSPMGPMGSYGPMGPGAAAPAMAMLPPGSPNLDGSHVALDLAAAGSPYAPHHVVAGMPNYVWPTTGGGPILVRGGYWDAKATWLACATTPLTRSVTLFAGSFPCILYIVCLRDAYKCGTSGLPAVR